MNSPGLDAKNYGEQCELFERAFTASYPPPDTFAGIALAAMLEGQRLRQPDWLHVIGWRLAAAIQVLKDSGWPVYAPLIHIPGRKKPIAEYSLPQWVIQEIAQRDSANG